MDNRVIYYITNSVYTRYKHDIYTTYIRYKYLIFDVLTPIKMA